MQPLTLIRTFRGNTLKVVSSLYPAVSPCDMSRPCLDAPTPVQELKILTQEISGRNYSLRLKQTTKRTGGTSSTGGNPCRPLHETSNGISGDRNSLPTLRNMCKFTALYARCNGGARRESEGEGDEARSSLNAIES